MTCAWCQQPFSKSQFLFIVQDVISDETFVICDECYPQHKKKFSYVDKVQWMHVVKSPFIQE